MPLHGSYGLAPPALGTDLHLVTRAATNVNLTSDQVVALAKPRNFIINGGMQVAQRDQLVVNANGRNYAGCDRIAVTAAGFTTVQFIQLQSSIGVTSGSSFSQQIGNLVTTGAGSLEYNQRIEFVNARALNGRTVTFSAGLVQQTGAPLDAKLVLRKANAVDDFSATTLLQQSAVTSTVSGAVTPLSFTCTLGGSDADNGIEVALVMPTVGAFAAGKQVFTFDWGLYIGSAAPPVPRIRSIAEELAECRRYCEVIDTGTATVGLSGFAVGTSTARIAVPFKVEKRGTTPSVTAILANISINYSGGNVTPTGITSFCGPEGGAIDLTVAGSPFTVGQGLQAGVINRGLIFSKEL